MTEATQYSKDKEEKHRRKIVLPCVIPWEYGSNKYASQKGQGGFGKIRNTTLKIEEKEPLHHSDATVVPFHLCPTMHGVGANQAGEHPFGSFREHVTKVQEHNEEEKKNINEMLVDKKATERVLKLWNQPNPNAKNDELYGKRRNAVSESVGGRRFTHEEMIKCRAALPRFQNVQETMAARDAKPGDALVTGFHPQRQVTTKIDGLDRTMQDQLDSNKYMAWLGGQLTLQSQSKTGGFNKPRDVVNKSFYDKVMNEKDLSPQQLFELRKAEREAKAERQRILDDSEAVVMSAAEAASRA